MNENKLLLSGVCPYCPAILDYSEDSRAVVCHSCGNVIPTRILRPLDFAKRENEQIENDRRIADGVTSSSAGIIYFDNFCESYDWREFALHSNLSVSTLDSVAEACKIKFSADPVTYYLDFRCKAIPVLKKIDGLDVLEVEIIDNYKSDDISDLFEFVDLYSSITKAIESKKDALITELKRDIKLAKRFAIDPFLLADLERTLEMFIEKVNGVKTTTNIEEIPGYAKAKAIKDAKLAEDIRKKGIDAEKTYQRGLQLLEAGRDKLKKIENPNENLTKLKALVGFMINSCKTAIHVKRLYIALEKLHIAGSRENAAILLDEIEAIILSEKDNVLDTIPMVRADSRLGWEPSMEYQADEECLKWKLRQLDYELDFTIPKFRKSNSL